MKAVDRMFTWCVVSVEQSGYATDMQTSRTRGAASGQPILRWTVDRVVDYAPTG